MQNPVKLNPASLSQAAERQASLTTTPRRLWLMWLIGTIIALVPLFMAPIPPMGQHFFNVVRMEILAHPDTYARNFIVQWDVMPDLAMDLTVPWLARFMPLAQASQLFVCIYLALLTSGTLVLSRAINSRWSALPLLSFLFLYNWILVRGYDNNLFGLGVCLWALAAHVALRRSVVARTIVSSVSALLIYFCHLFPLGVFGLVIGTWELGCLLQEGVSVRRTLTHATAALLPFVLPAILLLKSSTGELSNGIDFGL